MGNRLSKIYTRTGDDGTTGLGNGQRLSKDALRVETYGTVDELNSIIGVVQSVLAELTIERKAWLMTQLSAIQHELFDLGGELSIPGFNVLASKAWQRLETQMDDMNEVLPPLKNFILPAGPLVVSHVHHARTVCRRAERLLVGLQAAEHNIPVSSMQYCNRLSDWLFVLARYLCHLMGVPEVLWQRPPSK